MRELEAARSRAEAEAAEARREATRLEAERNSALAKFIAAEGTHAGANEELRERLDAALR